MPLAAVASALAILATGIPLARGLVRQAVAEEIADVRALKQDVRHIKAVQGVHARNELRICLGVERLAGEPLGCEQAPTGAE
jgi:hypothetical protein